MLQFVPYCHWSSYCGDDTNGLPILQYFLPAAKKGINHQIELAILRADRMGVKVLSLAALNKVSSLLHCNLSHLLFIIYYLCIST